jgi:hypothetical protein
LGDTLEECHLRKTSIKNNQLQEILTSDEISLSLGEYLLMIFIEETQLITKEKTTSADQL